MARRRQSNRRQYDDYMKEVSSYNTKVDAGRSVKAADPSQEAFSEDAETLRQARAVDKANAYDKLMRRR